MKRLLMLAIIIAIVAASCSYIIHYRFRDIVSLVINKETKGIYAFDAGAIDISLFKRNIRIKDALLSCRDTLHTNPHYEISVPEIYLSIQSWRDLLLHKKISVDSLAVIAPHISSHEHFAIKKQPASFHAVNITANIEKLLQQLQVHSFRITDASFAFSRIDNPVPLEGSHVSFSISNFSKKENASLHLFSSDDISLMMGPQHWVLPDGKHEINFQKLHFSGKDQFFEIDSCLFKAEPVDSVGKMELSAEKIFFNSKQLSALYEKNELLIDTLICFKPVLNTETNNKISQQTNSNAVVSNSFGQLFRNINFKYIDIREGSLSLINKYRPNYSTQKADLKAYNLNISKDSVKPLTTDSILLSLKNLQFLTTDSMFQLTVGAFSLHNDDVLFSNTVYSPTEKFRGDKGFSFIAPALHLRNIDLAALMDKRLIADTAELVRPVITVYDKSKLKIKIVDTLYARPKPAIAQKKNFYQTLHGLSELIEVAHFNILNGSLGYAATGVSRVKLRMDGLNASILLNRLFQSDSLIDIKRSLPKVAAGSLSIQSPKMNLQIKNYEFRGDRRHNKADFFELGLANGTKLTATGLYWEVFDWDMFQNHKIIQVDYFKMKELFVSLRKKQQPDAEKKAPKDLPVMHIARFNIDNLHFDDSSAKSNSRFDAADICIDNIGSQNKFLTWGNAEGLFDHFVINTGNDKKISVGTVKFTTQYSTAVHDVKLHLQQPSGYTNIYLPLLKLETDIHSTDFSALHIRSIETDKAAIEVYKKQQQTQSAATGKPLQIPVALIADRMMIRSTDLKFTKENEKDTMAFAAKIDIDAKDVNTFKKQQKLLAYNKINIELGNLQLNKGKLTLEIPKTVLALTGGLGKNENEQPIVSAGVFLQWANAHLQVRQSDTTGIIAKNLGGSFADPVFSFYPKMQMQWQSLVNKITINECSGYYKGKSITATAGNISWEPSLDMLSLRNYAVLPNQPIEVVFSRPGAMQGDYMTIQGEAVNISGIKLHKHQGDSLLQVHKVFVDSVSLTTVRDKRMPFKHGQEKEMPAALISAIKMPIHVDSIVVQRSKVTVNEIAIKSAKKGTIPLNDINAVITNFSSDHKGDSLTLIADARLLNYKINRFYYKEAYNDSLSYFFAGVHISPMALQEFSSVTIPLASVGVDRGNADTMFAQWVGNKYGAYGRMNFYYKDLKVRLLDAKDNTKKPLLLSLVNAIAPLILHKNNSEASQMFFMRDREKFVFNYWVKTILSGLSTSAGIKRNKKMIKNYKKAKAQYSLPMLYD
ncbi:MAG: hypothetical protein QM726_24705 [Chitinophagaceae bacterium]